jgi:very-short-patch-repair endonuclease
MIGLEIHQKLIAQSRRMRANPTPAETLLWSKLRKRKLGGYRFLRQRIIGPYIVDFYCAELDLIIEIDGPIHQHQREYDEHRTKYLEIVRKHVIRFTNQQILEDVDAVLRVISALCKNA